MNYVVQNVEQKCKKILLKICRIKDIFLEHPIRYLFFISIFIILGIIIFNLLLINSNQKFINITYTSENDQLILIKGITIQNWGILLSGIIAIIGGIWAMYQYDKSVKYKQQEKSSQILKYFSTDIVNKISIIDCVMSKCPNIVEIMVSISKRNFLKFNYYEMNELIDSEYISNYKKYINNPEIDNTYIKIIKDIYDEDKVQNYPKKFITLLNTTLNDLEAICMDVSSNVAGTQFLYHSLHTLFFKIIQMLYIKISLFNSDNVDTLYVNIIHVYNLWMPQKYKDIKMYKKTTKKIKKIENNASKEVQKLLDKKPNRV